MPSWQSYLTHPILKWVVKRKLARAGDALTARHVLTHPLPPLPGVAYMDAQIGGIAGEWVRAPGPAAGTLLYLHGGGYFACSPQTHRAVTTGYAKRGFDVFAPDYRLAPEFPFPAALNDALAVYRAFALQYGGKFVIGGDSAGGGLTLACLLAAKDEGLPMPAAALLFSPWTDLACTGESLRVNAGREAMLVSSRMVDAAGFYLDGEAPTNPLASPLYGDLTGLPPLLIQVGEPEILRDDSTRLAARAELAGVEVDLSVWPNLPHVWQVSQIFLPEAREALDKAADFGKQHLALHKHGG